MRLRAADEFAQGVLPVIRAIQAAGATSFASMQTGSTSTASSPPGAANGTFLPLRCA